MTTAAAPAALPQLGPMLGRLITPPQSSDRPGVLLEPVRLVLLTELFERAGAARLALAAGDAPGSRAALGYAAWLEVWEGAVTGAARTLGGEIEARMRDAARIARLPAVQLASGLPTPDDGSVLRARLSAAGVGLERAAGRLENGPAEWSEAIRHTAGELEDAWEHLVATARGELAAGEARAAEIRAWRRGWMPLIVAGAGILAVAGWLGLTLGGFLPVPGWLKPAAEWFWNLPWP